MSLRNWGKLDEGVPQHAIERYARGGDSLVTSYLVMTNFHDKIRVDLSHYETAKRSPDPWLNSYKCYDILLGILKQMLNDPENRFKDKIEKLDAKKKTKRLEKLLYGDNSTEWADYVKENYKEVAEALIERDKIAGEATTFESFAWPFKQAAANLYMISMLQKRTPATIDEEENPPEGVLFILGSQKPVEAPIYGIAILGMKELLREGNLIFQLEMFIYQAIERGFGREQLELFSELSQAPYIMPHTDDTDPEASEVAKRFKIESPYTKDAKQAKKKKGGTPAKPQKRKRKQFKVEKQDE
ncbi:hypothetical protein KAR91_45385 [Candidatus Pacearchaeota archaeon]|nr:hypothetical protein [Candidatus Pacearchaeota archaeon]